MSVGRERLWPSALNKGPNKILRLGRLNKLLPRTSQLTQKEEPKGNPPPTQTGQPNPEATRQARQAETRPTGGAANREPSRAEDPRTQDTPTHTQGDGRCPRGFGQGWWARSRTRERTQPPQRTHAPLLPRYRTLRGETSPAGNSQGELSRGHKQGSERSVPVETLRLPREGLATSTQNHLGIA